MTDERLDQAKKIRSNICRFEELFERAKKTENVVVKLYKGGVDSGWDIRDYIGEDEMQEMAAQIREKIRIRLEDLRTLYERL